MKSFFLLFLKEQLNPPAFQIKILSKWLKTFKSHKKFQVSYTHADWEYQSINFWTLLLRTCILKRLLKFYLATLGWLWLFWRTFSSCFVRLWFSNIRWQFIFFWRDFCYQRWCLYHFNLKDNLLNGWSICGITAQRITQACVKNVVDAFECQLIKIKFCLSFIARLN